jgi:hypothetical protein
LHRGVCLGACHPVRYGGSLTTRPTRAAKPTRYGKMVGSAIVMTAAISVTRAATLIKQRRIVSNSASRQNERRGAKPRRVSSSQ